MADSAIADFTDGVTANATDRIAAARSPFGAGDDVYLTPAYVSTYIEGLAHTWTQAQTFANVIIGSSNTLAWSTDLFLARDAANTLALRNSTTAQNFRVYNTYTDASNYERLEMGYVANVAYLRAAKLGTGASRALKIWGGGDVYIEPDNGAFTGVVRLNCASMYLNGTVGFIASAGSLMLTDSSGSAFTGRIQLGGTTSSFNGIARDGAGTKFVGADGTSVSWTKVPGVAVASLPAAATAGAGARSFVTDALAPTYGATVANGGAAKVPVYSDGTNWIVG